MNFLQKYVALTAIGFASLSFPAISSERFTCTMQWEHQEESIPFVIEIDGDNVVTSGGITTSTFKVAANNEIDLLLYQPITRPWIDSNLGFLTASLDKKSGTLLYSFATHSYRLFANGSCRQLDR